MKKWNKEKAKEKKRITIAKITTTTINENAKIDQTAAKKKRTA